jgi:general secretion pathway protein N
MRRHTHIIPRCWLWFSSLRQKSAVRSGTTLLCLATLGGSAAVAAAVIGKIDSNPAPALTNSATLREPNRSDPAREAAAGNPLWAIPIEVLAATRDRPLFSPTRRPPAPPVFTVAAAEQPRSRPPEPERPPLLLIGTAAGETTAIAVFLDQTTKRTVHLRSGQSQYGWVLGTVYKKQVVLQKDRVVVYLPLSAATAPAASTQVAESRHERRQR